MSNYTEKAQLIGGGDIVYVDRAFIRSYREVQEEYHQDIINTNLRFRFSNSTTQVSIEKAIIVHSQNIVVILEDIMEIREDDQDPTSQRFLDARIDDSRILLTLIHDDYDTIEVLSVGPDTADAINYLHLHPTPHPSGISRIGQIRMGTSNKRNRALSSGAFLVRGEDRTSTGINRVLSKLADNSDVVESRTRRSHRVDLRRKLPCSITNGKVSRILPVLIGGEILTTTNLDLVGFVDLENKTNADGSSSPMSGADRLTFLFNLAKNSGHPQKEPLVSFDFFIGEENNSGEYVYNKTDGRTGPNNPFYYSFIALSEAARDLAVTVFENDGGPSNEGPITTENYWGSADRLGTIHGPRYWVNSGATVIDFFTLRFYERNASLSLVNQGDIIITEVGVFEVDFIGEDTRTVGIRQFGGDLAQLFSLRQEVIDHLGECPFPTTLVPGTNIPEVIIVKSGIGVKGEYYGLGMLGHDPSMSATTQRTFRVRSLSRNTDSTATDDTAFRKMVRTFQEAIDPYSGTSTSTITTSFRALNAVGGVLKLPKLYSVPTDIEELHVLDYMTGSRTYGPLRVSPSQYAAVPNHLSIFNGIGGQPSDFDDPEVLAALADTRQAYDIASASLKNRGTRTSLLRNVDAVLLEEDYDSAQLLTTWLNGINQANLAALILPVALRTVSHVERRTVVNALRNVMQVGGRSLVYKGAEAQLDAANGLTIKLKSQHDYFSEEDVGRIFIVTLPVLPYGSVLLYQTYEQWGMEDVLSARSKKRQVRVRMHTWTSPGSARFIPVDDMRFLLYRELNVTIEPSLGYGNIGYGALTNAIIPVEHGMNNYTDPYPTSKLTEGTEYRHIYPGNISYLDVATPFTTSLRSYSTLRYIKGDAIDAANVPYVPDNLTSSDGGDVSIFNFEKSLFLVSESIVTFANKTSVAEAHTQDGRLDLNHSNRVHHVDLKQLTYLPLLKSGNQKLNVKSDDFLLYTLQSGAGVSGDIVAFSPNVYEADSGSAFPTDRQPLDFSMLSVIRCVGPDNEYSFQFSQGSAFAGAVPAALQSYFYHTDENGDSVSYGSVNYDEFIEDLFIDKPISISRGASGIREEDTFVLKDLHLYEHGVATPLNCEDILTHSTLTSQASLGHVREVLSEEIYAGTKLTSNKVIYTLEDESKADSGEILAIISEAYGVSSPYTTILTQYVAQETIKGDYTFQPPYNTVTDDDGHIRLFYTGGVLIPTLREVPLKTRSWFKLQRFNSDGSEEDSVFFTFNNEGALRRLGEYCGIGDATSSIYGAFRFLDSFSGAPTWEGISWVTTGIAEADITRVKAIELLPNGDVPFYKSDTFAVHSVLKSSDIPYFPTAHIKNITELAPVSKELGKTLSSVLTEDAPLDSKDDLTSQIEVIRLDRPRHPALLSNVYPSIMRTESGKIEKVTFDSYSNSGMDINVYDGEPGMLGTREDGVRMSSFTRGFTDSLPDTPRTSRKKNTLHVLSEEMISGVRVTHHGIVTTQFEDTLVRHSLAGTTQVYMPLVQAGLAVDLGDVRAWSSDSSTKHGVSDPYRLTSPLNSERRNINVDNADVGEVSIPLLVGAKIESNKGIGLYVDWRAEPSVFQESDLPDPVDRPVYHLTTSVDNSSVLIKGEQDIGASLHEVYGSPLLDRDSARAAITALGGITAVGTFKLVGDLRCTRYADENIGDGHHVLAGVRGHLNPTTAPRAQNYNNSLTSLSNHYIEVTETNTSVLALVTDTSSVLNPTSEESDIVAGTSSFRSNRNPDGISQQQLGERHRIVKYKYAPFFPRNDTDVIIRRSDYNPDLPQFHPVSIGDFYDLGKAVEEIDPTYFAVETTQSGSGDRSLVEAKYRPLAIALFPGQQDGNPMDTLNGYKEEYLLLVMPRGIMSYGDSYLGRTVTLQLSTVVSVPVVTTDTDDFVPTATSSDSSTTDSTTTDTGTVSGDIDVTGVDLGGLIPGESESTTFSFGSTVQVSAVISIIEDRADVGVTFVKLVPTLDRFDNHVVVDSVNLAYGPESFSPALDNLYTNGYITSLSRVDLGDIPFDWDSTWGNWWEDFKHTAAYGVGYHPAQWTRLTGNDFFNIDDQTLGELQIEMVVHGREWVLNAYQAYVSDRLYILNDSGDQGSIYLKRDNTLHITSPRDLTLTSPNLLSLTNGNLSITTTEDIDITAGGDAEITTGGEFGLSSDRVRVASDSDIGFTWRDYRNRQAAAFMENLVANLGYVTVTVRSIWSESPGYKVWDVHNADGQTSPRIHEFSPTNNVLTTIQVVKSSHLLPDLRASLYLDPHMWDDVGFVSGDPGAEVNGYAHMNKMSLSFWRTQFLSRLMITLDPNFDVDFKIFNVSAHQVSSPKLNEQAANRNRSGEDIKPIPVIIDRASVVRPWNRATEDDPNSLTLRPSFVDIYEVSGSPTNMLIKLHNYEAPNVPGGGRNIKIGHCLPLRIGTEWLVEKPKDEWFGPSYDFHALNVYANWGTDPEDATDRERYSAEYAVSFAVQRTDNLYGVAEYYAPDGTPRYSYTAD